MAKTYNTLTIEVKEDITDIITAKQDDTQSRYLDVYLQDDGQPINLTGQEVRIYGKKQDGKSFFNNGEITNATQGRCQFELTNQALAVAGKLQVEISIWQNNERILTTQTFLINVIPKIRNDDAIESSNEFGAVVILFQKLYDFWLDIEKLLGKTDDTGGSLTTGTVMAKLNALLNANGVGGLKVKSVQHGYVEGNSMEQKYRDIAINSINVSKSIFISDTEMNDNMDHIPYLYNSTNIRQQGGQYGGNGIYFFTYFNWSIIEFE